MRNYSLRPPAAANGLVNCGKSERSLDHQETRNSTKSRDKFLDFCFDEAPVRGFRVMRNDVVIFREARNPEELAGRLEGATRGKIERLSGSSRRRLALVAGNSPVAFRSFVTVSYPAVFPADGKLVKRHLHALLAALRRRCGAVEYLWFLEFQARGAPHLHLFLSYELPFPHSEMVRKNGRKKAAACLTHWPSQDWISARWFEIVGSGDERHLRAGAAWEVVEKSDGAARYVAKESYKTFQKVVPKAFQNVGRFWGTSRGVTPDDGLLVRASEDQIRELFPDSLDAAGRPFPVLFSAAESYRKIRDTAKDPAKVNAWKSSGRSQKMLPGSNSESGSWIGIETRRPVKNRSHGSTLSDLTSYRAHLRDIGSGS